MSWFAQGAGLIKCTRYVRNAMVFGNRCPAGWGLTPQTQLEVSRDEFPLQINRLLPPQTCLSESVWERVQEEKKKTLYGCFSILECLYVSETHFYENYIIIIIL